MTIHKILIFPVVMAAALLSVSTAQAGQRDAVVGAIVGSAVGSLIGHELNGRQGAVVGSAMGAAIGVSVATDDRRYGDDAYSSSRDEKPSRDWRDRDDDRYSYDYAYEERRYSRPVVRQVVVYRVATKDYRDRRCDRHGRYHRHSHHYHD